MDVRQIKLGDIPSEIIVEGKKNNLIFRDVPNAMYFGGFLDDQLVTLGCLVFHKNRHATMKTNFTVKECRQRGYFSELNVFMLDYAREHDVEMIILNCLKDSVGIHLRHGARIWKVTKNISWMIYDKGTF